MLLIREQAKEREFLGRGVTCNSAGAAPYYLLAGVLPYK